MEAVGPVALCVTLLHLRRAGLGKKDDAMILPEWGWGEKWAWESFYYHLFQLISPSLSGDH